MSKNKAHFAKRYRIDRGNKFRLKDYDPGDMSHFNSKAIDGEWLQRGVARLAQLQEKLYAQDHWALLIIFQAMDAAGKDGAIKHVMSGINPQGCQVFSFKTPSEEDLDHDFLWRCHKCMPERGRIGIFNRSYYEETLVVRVHPEYLQRQHLPEALVSKNIWQERFTDIKAFERYLTRNGVMIRKFFLHVSKAEQKKRLLSRLEEPDKNWKFSIDDLSERHRWHEYMDVYEEMIQETATADAPWYVVPADHKSFTRLVVAEAIIEALEEMNLAFPKMSSQKRREIAAAKKKLK